MKVKLTNYYKHCGQLQLLPTVIIDFEFNRLHFAFIAWDIEVRVR